MTAQTFSAETFSAIPPIVMDDKAKANPLKGVLVTVFTLKVAVAVVLLATVSLAPPVNADSHYKTLASID